jgi:peptidoglycan hydrolase-like protein with peptidoglycan-binding domain
VIIGTPLRIPRQRRVDGDRIVGNTSGVNRAPTPRRTAFAVAVTAALAAVTGLAACTKPSPTAAAPPAVTPSTPATSGPSAAPAPPVYVPPPPVSKPVLQYGDKGEAVLRLQQQLNSLGYWTTAIDGKFGDTTQQAVFALQKAAKIKPNGTVGPATWAALDKQVRPTPRSHSGTLIEVDLARDLLMFVKDGQLQYTLNTSTGGGYQFVQQGQNEVAITPTGHFTTYRVIDALHKSPLGLMLRPRFFFEGFAIHGDGSVPSIPVSHGCVRVSNSAIDWIWSANLDPIGMTVWIYS